MPVNNAVGFAQLKLLLMVVLTSVMVFDVIVNTEKVLPSYRMSIRGCVTSSNGDGWVRRIN